MTDQEYMRRAIELAKKGAGWTNPNPMVGAVIVRDGRIIGEGYHQKCGELHAERNALASLSEPAKGATMYVTLEPCCHYGRTPPCTEAILEHGISRVVIGSRDPNPLVAGKGAQMLREHGVVVEEDFLREECDAINPVFFHYITTGRPYVVMKYAMTLDGKIAAHTGASKWITGETARQHVHQLRSRCSVIMAGIGTVLADDPMLNCRLLQSEASANSSHLQLTEGISASFTVGQSEHASLPPHQPLRVIVDSQLRIPLDSQICRSARDYPTIVACAQREEEKAAALEALGIRVLCFPPTSEVPCSDSGSASVSETVSSDFGTASVNETAAAQTEHTDLRALVTWLGQNKYDSILIEGGGTLHEAALRAGIVNHVCAYIAPKLLGGREAKTPVEGIGADCPELGAQLTNLQITPLGDDLLLSYDIAGGMNHVYWNC